MSLNFDAQGDPNAQFVVRTPTLSLFNTTQINLLNGAQASNMLFLSGNIFLNTSSPLSGIFLSTGNNSRFTGSSGDRLTLYGGTNVGFEGNLAGPAAVATVPLSTEVPEPSSALLCLDGAGLFAVRRWTRA